jgi:chromosome segregation ATPase
VTDFQQPTPGNPVFGPNGQSFDEYRWSQLEEANRANVQAITRLTAQLDTVRDAVGSLAGEIESINVRMDTHSRSLINLTESVRQLEEATKPPVKARDELNDRIVAFLESHAGLKFTAISIDENLGGTGKDISDRLKTLVRNGRIRMFAIPNRRPFYQALERTEDQPS